MHMRVRSGPELIQGIERGRYVGRMLVPVGHVNGSEDDIPAPRGVTELAPQPAGRHDSVSVGGG